MTAYHSLIHLLSIQPDLDYDPPWGKGLDLSNDCRTIFGIILKVLEVDDSNIRELQ